VLDYDPETGVFTRKKNGNSRFSTNSVGYTQIGIDGHNYRGHRLAWLYVYGEWPRDQIDHINGARTDNRITNLRESSQAENCGNVARHRDNKSGFKGVFPFRKKWAAQICRDGVKKHLGTFETPEAAHAAYSDAATQVFGEFARIA
jgi:hypothetical protein